MNPGIHSLLAFGILLSCLTGSAQEKAFQSITLTSQFSQWGEVYFAVPLRPEVDISRLTGIISIDNIRNDTLFAYANPEMMEEFLGLNYSYHLLRHPQAIDPVMDTGASDGPLTWNYYPTYTAYLDLMAAFQSNYPGLCKIDTITVLPSGRDILAAKISDNVSNDENEPGFLYTSSIHGNELAGYVLMLALIEHLLVNYDSDTSIASLVNNVEIWICPLSNPDGTFHGGNNTISGAIRYNANGVDLNRNYPDPQNGPHPDGFAWQPETLAFMDFAAEHDLTMAANFHGGAEVFNYPWDTWATLAADNNWWVHCGRSYADTVHNYSLPTYFDDFNNGITNGYAWYEINGGRQDYMNYYHYCREVTIELTNSYIPAASSLPNYWNFNRHSLLNYMRESLYGVRGIVTDSVTGSAIKAKVFINGHDIDSSHVYSSLPVGNYHRYLSPGTYDLTFSAPGYHSKTIPGITTAYFNTTITDVQLKPVLPALNGKVIYDTNDTIPLSGVPVFLLDSLNDTLAFTVTDTSGSFIFNDLFPGQYHCAVSCPLDPGGFNSLDALLILKHFVHLETLSGIRKAAADVNGNNGINALDAMLVQQRFVGLIESFPMPPWIFSAPPITINNTDTELIINAICTGDVNASYTP
jgi:hypothetical protein